MNLEQLKEVLIDRGVAKVGFANVENLVDKRYKDYNWAISLVVKLSDGVMDEVTDSPTYSYFHHYRTVNAFLDAQMLYIVTMIERWGYRAIPVGASQSVKDMGDKYTGIFQHKTAAVYSNLGWIGKSGLLVTPEYGPRVRLGTVLTDMLLPTPEVKPVGKCGGCTICCDNCPSMAIRGVEYVPGAKRETILDAEACSSYMHKAFQHIGRGAVCGICVASCPYGKRHAK